MPSVTQVSDAYVEALAVVDPVRASRSMGVARDATHLTDYSPDGHAAVGSVLRATLADLAEAVPVDDAERLGRGYLEDECRSRLAVIDSGEAQRLVSTLVGAPAAVRMSFDLMATDGDEEWERIGRRLAEVPRAMAGYRASLAASATRGETAATRVVEAVAAQCQTWASAWFSVLVDRYGDGPLRSMLDSSARQASAAYGDLARWLREDLAPRGATADGVGDDRYRVWATHLLGTELDLDDAYAWGVEEWERLEVEKAQECDRILPGGDLAAVRHHLESGGGDTVEGVDAYQRSLQELLDEAIDGLSGVEFDIPPPLRRCLVGIPPEGSALIPYYSPPSEDLAQPGTAWFPTGGADHFPLWDQHTTVYHEAVPGHHLQLGMTRVLPLVRAHRLGGNAACLEGWALYAERLMDELGWFRTPATRLGFLCMQAFRAARVVVDIGLHTGRGGWTWDRAVDAMADAGGKSQAFAESEVLRYLSWPAQATSYKLGERTWMAGRRAAMEAQGRAFDRKAWHARALALGSLGLDRLEGELAAVAAGS